MTVSRVSSSKCRLGVMDLLKVLLTTSVCQCLNALLTLSNNTQYQITFHAALAQRPLGVFRDSCPHTGFFLSHCQTIWFSAPQVNRDWSSGRRIWCTGWTGILTCLWFWVEEGQGRRPRKCAVVGCAVRSLQYYCCCCRCWWDIVLQVGDVAAGQS